jgi:uncharacterized protein (DUF1778 family)
VSKRQVAKTRQALRKRRVALKSDRIEMRVTSAQKRLIERAAAVSGLSLTDFALNSLQASARTTLESQSWTVLAPEYAAAFVEAMLRPPAPNQRLRDAARRYRARVGR